MGGHDCDWDGVIELFLKLFPNFKLRLVRLLVMRRDVEIQDNQVCLFAVFVDDLLHAF